MNAAIKDKRTSRHAASARGRCLTRILLSLFQKMVKQRQESAELYEKGGRPELAAHEHAEIEIITGLSAQADVGK